MLRKSFFIVVSFVILLAFSIIAFVTVSTRRAAQANHLSAHATMRDQAGQILGTVKIVEVRHGVELNLELNSLPPGMHGIHFHENGVCEGDFSSAGAHFNPNKRAHGLNHAHGPHAGDLPNLVVSQNGTTTDRFKTNLVTLTLGRDSLIQKGGTSLVIHADPDDFTSDPSGNSGKRIACGMIVQDETKN